MAATEITEAEFGIFDTSGTARRYDSINEVLTLEEAQIMRLTVGDQAGAYAHLYETDAPRQTDHDTFVIDLQPRATYVVEIIAQDGTLGFQAGEGRLDAFGGVYGPRFLTDLDFDSYTDGTARSVPFSVKGRGDTHLAVTHSLDNVGRLFNAAYSIEVTALFTNGADVVTLPVPGTYDALRGNDEVKGSKGKDVVKGGGGADVLDGGKGADALFGNKGADALAGGKGNDTLDGGGQGDFLDGGGNSDELSGGKGSDTLDGGKGSDTLDGGKGADTLDGGKGNDILSGGAAGDTFRFVGRSGDDVIEDYNPRNDDYTIEASTEITYDEVDGHAVAMWGPNSVTFLDIALEDLIAPVG